MSERYELDDIGHMYASISTKNWCGVFRLSCVFFEPIEPYLLQLAIDRMQAVVPFYFSELGKGFFWHYLKHNDCQLIPKLDDEYPCRQGLIQQRKLFRVLYYKHRLAIECSHILCDGGGAWLFFKTLIKYYLIFKGHNISEQIGCIVVAKNKKPKDNYEEFADFSYGFLPINKKKATQLQDCNILNEVSKNYKTQFIDKKSKQSPYFLTHIVASTISLKQLSKQYNCTVGQLLISIIVYSIMISNNNVSSNTCNNATPLVVNASIDLRKKQQVQPLNNFFTCLYITINGCNSLATVIEKVKTSMSNIDTKYLKQSINTLVLYKKIAKRMVLPRALKDLILKAQYNNTGEKLATFSISNYGQLQVPNEFYKHIATFESANGVAKNTKGIELSIVSYNGNTTISLCSSIDCGFLYRSIQRILTSYDINTSVYGNLEQVNLKGAFEYAMQL